MTSTPDQARAALRLLVKAAYWTVEHEGTVDEPDLALLPPEVQALWAEIDARHRAWFAEEGLGGDEPLRFPHGWDDV